MLASPMIRLFGRLFPGPVAALGQSQKSECASGKTRGKGELELSRNWTRKGSPAQSDDVPGALPIPRHPTRRPICLRNKDPSPKCWGLCYVMPIAKREDIFKAAIDGRPPRHGRRSSHRPATGMVPAARNARSSLALTRFRTQSPPTPVSVAGNGIPVGGDKGAKTPDRRNKKTKMILVVGTTAEVDRQFRV
jgi:hypothetical protein